MKRLLSIVLSLVLLCSCIPSVFAASDEATKAANTLYELGLFSGTGTDSNGNPMFDLDRAPTRHEAVTMLVNLLGKQEEALNRKWDIPFTDVAEWAKPFVGYAYANSLTSGTSSTTYGGNDLVTASQYITFVLRVLGYEVGTDFQWDRAWELSDKIGLTDGEYGESNTVFMRGDVAIISCNALGCMLKGQNVTLQDSFSVRNEVPVPSNKVPLSVVIEIMELTQEGFVQQRSALVELADAARYMSYSSTTMVPVLAQSGQVFLNSAVDYFSEAIIKCADYQETQTVKSLLSDVVDKLSASTAYQLTGSLENAIDFMLLVATSNTQESQNAIIEIFNEWSEMEF